MNAHTFQAIINTVGVSLTMVGALLIAVDVTRQYKGYQYEPIVQYFSDLEGDDDMGIVQRPPKTNDLIKWERTNRKLMLAGLIAIVVGGALQIWASWII